MNNYCTYTSIRSYTQEIRGTNLNTVIRLYLRGYWDTKERLVISYLAIYFFKHKELELEINVDLGPFRTHLWAKSGIFGENGPLNGPGDPREHYDGPYEAQRNSYMVLENPILTSKVVY